MVAIAARVHYRIAAQCSARRSARGVAAAALPKTPIRLVALDVDGTMLDSENKVRPGVKAAIAEAQKRGVPVVLSTGRCPLAANSLLGPGGVDTDGGVFLGGALGIDAFGKLRRDIKVPAEVVQRVMEQASTFGLVSILVSRNKFYASREDKWTESLVAAGDPLPVILSEQALYRSYAKKVNLLCLMGEREVVDAAEAAVTALVAGTSAQVVRPTTCMLDIVPGPDEWSELGGKASGLAEICAWRGIPPEAVMAVGDSGNDLTMLRWAGWAVAMGNATAPVKMLADAVVAGNDDDARPGVAEAIEEFVLALASR